jgi:hypothetical protein
MPFGLLSPKDFQIIWLSNLMYISMANATHISCALNWISTLLVCFYLLFCFIMLFIWPYISSSTPIYPMYFTTQSYAHNCSIAQKDIQFSAHDICVALAMLIYIKLESQIIWKSIGASKPKGILIRLATLGYDYICQMETDLSFIKLFLFQYFWLCLLYYLSQLG